VRERTSQLSPLLSGVAARTAEKLSSAAATIQLPRRATIYTQGDKCTGLHVVLSGMVKVSLPLPGSAERVLALHGPGAWFGESALLLQETHFATAETLEPTALAHIPSGVVLRSLRRDQTLAVRMLAEVSRRLRTSMLENGTAASGARQSLIGFLLDAITFAQQSNGPATIQLPVEKRVIASRLNIKAETLSRLFQELTRDGLIAVNGRRIVIPDVNRLRAALSECDGARKRGR